MRGGSLRGRASISCGRRRAWQAVSLLSIGRLQSNVVPRSGPRSLDTAVSAARQTGDLEMRRCAAQSRYRVGSVRFGDEAEGGLRPRPWPVHDRRHSAARVRCLMQLATSPQVVTKRAPRGFVWYTLATSRRQRGCRANCIEGDEGTAGRGMISSPRVRLPHRQRTSLAHGGIQRTKRCHSRDQSRSRVRRTIYLEDVACEFVFARLRCHDRNRLGRVDHCAGRLRIAGRLTCSNAALVTIATRMMARVTEPDDGRA